MSLRVRVRVREADLLTNTPLVRVPAGNRIYTMVNDQLSVASSEETRRKRVPRRGAWA